MAATNGCPESQRNISLVHDDRTCKLLELPQTGGVENCSTRQSNEYRRLSPAKSGTRGVASFIGQLHRAEEYPGARKGSPRQGSVDDRGRSRTNPAIRDPGN